VERITRRRLLASGAAAATTAAFPAIALGHGRKTRLVYKLDPEWGADDPHCPRKERQKTRSCHACNACHRHARNKLWSSGAAIERAHLGCKCEVVAVPIPKEVFTFLFGPENHPLRSEVDRRDTWVHRALRSTGV
jgi:hypothetical protein